jgi:hypothetical protein
VAFTEFTFIITASWVRSETDCISHGRWSSEEEMLDGVLSMSVGGLSHVVEDSGCGSQQDSSGDRAFTEYIMG